MSVNSRFVFILLIYILNFEFWKVRKYLRVILVMCFLINRNLDYAKTASFLDGRLSKSKMTKYEIITTIDQEYGFDFAAAAKVLGVAEVSLKNEYEKSSKQYRKFHVIFVE